MAEKKRACGYRKIGGTYLIGGNVGQPCGRLPARLHVCPTCSGGIKQTRGWTWVRPGALLRGLPECGSGPLDSRRGFCSTCPMSNPEQFADETGRCGLIWVGEQFYKTPADFMREAAEQGVCRRITAPPKGAEAGKTWILLAHPKAVTVRADCLTTDELEALNLVDAEPEALIQLPGIFQVFKLERIEKCVSETEFENEEEMEKLRKRGITPVALPDDAKHRGTVYDKDEEPELGLIAGAR